MAHDKDVKPVHVTASCIVMQWGWSFPKVLVRRAKSAVEAKLCVFHGQARIGSSKCATFDVQQHGWGCPCRWYFLLFSYRCCAQSFAWTEKNSAEHFEVVLNMDAKPETWGVEQFLEEIKNKPKQAQKVFFFCFKYWNWKASPSCGMDQLSPFHLAF